MALTAVSDRNDFKFGDAQPDIRKWTVKTETGDRLGTVDDVLIDDAGRTRYLDVDLAGSGKHVLVPSGQARVHTSDREVRVPGIGADGFAAVPEYTHDPSTIDADYERRLATAYDSAYEGKAHYHRPDYSGWSAGATDRRPSGQLARLDELDDVEVADHEPDPRGWKVIGADGTELGRVDHLIGDTGAMKVRYLTMKVDRNLFGEDRQVLIPVGHARLDREDHRVRLSGLSQARVADLPAYTGGAIDRDYETRLTRGYDEGYTAERRYEHPRYREDALYGTDREARIPRTEEELTVGKREREAGEVDVRKRVETEHVREPVKVKHEEVEVERRPVSGKAAAGADIGEEEVRVPIKEEEVVVEKRPRVKEEVVVRKREVEETEYVDEEVRKERVDVERHGDVETERR